jgi:class 3 adenylate cyclase
VWRSLASTSECLDADGDFPGSDAAAWRDPVGAYIDAASPAVVEMGGKVAKKLGDGLMALFGHPVAQENDAERAVRAALAMPQDKQVTLFRASASAARSRATLRRSDQSGIG